MNSSIDLDRLKQSIPILDLAKFLGLEVKGKMVRCYNGKAHKHNDQHFSMGLDVEKNRYKCFTCGEQGSIIDLYMTVKGLDFNQAIQELTEMAGLTYIAQKTQYKAQEGVQINKGVLTTTRIKNNGNIGDYSYIYQDLYTYCEGLDQESEEYLKSRGLKEKTIERFKLFSIKNYQETDKYLKSKFSIEELNNAGLLSEKGNLIFFEHKIIIPFFQNNKIIFLQARRLDQEQPKYLHIKRPVPLFNIDTLTKIEKGKKIYICEGVFDTMMLEQHGYRAVGIVGVNNFKNEYIDLFKDFDVVLALDNDEAGERGTQEIAKMFMLKGKKVKKKQLPSGIKDITDYFMSNITNNFNNLLEEPVEVTGIQKPRPVKEFLQSYYKTLGDGKQDLIGIRTGMEELDRKILGLDGLIVLGGIAGQGKTSLALQLAFNVCELETPAIFYSLEMSRRAILTKILSRLALVKYEDIILKGRYYLDETVQHRNLLGEDIEFNRLLSKDQINGLNNAKERLNKASDKFYLRTRENQEPNINLESVEQEINLIKAEHETDKVLVVIDHLQVFNLIDYKDQIDKENKLITGFKGITERTGACILLISQKNKAGFTSKGLQTIKGSVDIVYLADIVMFLEKENSGNDLDSVIATNNKQIDLIIDKNRYNAPSKIELDFNGEYSSFSIRRK